MLEVISALYNFHQHIVDVHLYIVFDQVLKDFVYYLLKGCPCVLEMEGHHLVAVYSLTSSEGHFVFIWWVHLDLTIARIDVHEVKEVMSYLNLYQLVDP